jgi:hypothetical protein
MNSTVRTNITSIDLHMSPRGFADAANEINSLDDKSPQVYIHIGMDDRFEGDVLRIGKAESGSYNRWITSSTGHQSTFFWAIGESGTKYENYVKRKCPSDYLLFFASLFGQKTKLIFLKFSNVEIAKKCESELIDLFCPVWERYKKIRKKDIYPILTGAKANIDNADSVSRRVARFGGAVKDIERQRAGNPPYLLLLPDIFCMEVNSLKKWSLESCEEIYNETNAVDAKKQRN